MQKKKVFVATIFIVLLSSFAMAESAVNRAFFPGNTQRFSYTGPTGHVALDAKKSPCESELISRSVQSTASATAGVSSVMPLILGVAGGSALLMGIVIVLACRLVNRGGKKQ